MVEPEPDDLAKICPIEQLEYVDENGSSSTLKDHQKEAIKDLRDGNPSTYICWDAESNFYWYKQIISRVDGARAKIVVCVALLGAFIVQRYMRCITWCFYSAALYY